MLRNGQLESAGGLVGVGGNGGERGNRLPLGAVDAPSERNDTAEDYRVATVNRTKIVGRPAEVGFHRAGKLGICSMDKVPSTDLHNTNTMHGDEEPANLRKEGHLNECGRNKRTRARCGSWNTTKPEGGWITETPVDQATLERG